MKARRRRLAALGPPYRQPVVKLRMSASLGQLRAQESPAIPAGWSINEVLSTPIEASAQLLVDAYIGTTDWEDGDDDTVAAAELGKAVSGAYGEFLPAASLSLVDAEARPVCQIVCCLEDGEPLILFMYTGRTHKGNGYAAFLIGECAARLHAQGFESVALYVTDVNPARRLYERLGFAESAG